MNMSGHIIQVISGGLFVLLFFIVRIVYGVYISYDFLSYLNSTSLLSTRILIFYYFANFSLNLLNYYWFYFVIKSFSKRVMGDYVKKKKV